MSDLVDFFWDNFLDWLATNNVSKEQLIIGAQKITIPKQPTDLKNTEHVRLQHKQAEIWFRYPSIKIGPNVFFIGIPSETQKADTIKMTWGKRLMKFESFDKKVTRYDECKICLEHTSPICLGIECFHEVCASCAAQKELAKKCPFCNNPNPTWKEIPPFKQPNFREEVIHGTLVTLFGPSPLRNRFFCSECDVTFAEDRLQYHLHVCMQLNSTQRKVMEKSGSAHNIQFSDKLKGLNSNCNKVDDDEE